MKWVDAYYAERHQHPYSSHEAHNNQIAVKYDGDTATAASWPWKIGYAIAIYQYACKGVLGRGGGVVENNTYATIKAKFECPN